jgi:hypothetical protein
MASEMFLGIPFARGQRRVFRELSSMASNEHAVFVRGERFEISRLRFEVSVYRVMDRFYGSWTCMDCPARGETDRLPDESAAMIAGKNAIEAHAAEFHGAK